MSLALRRSYTKARNHALLFGSHKSVQLPCFTAFLSRTFSEDKGNHPEFINSTILVENGLHVQELPVVVRKLRDLSEIEQKLTIDDEKTTQDSGSYQLIQTEFKQCVDLRDVFSLLSKCTKITPNIALGAMERIYDLEKNPISLLVESSPSMHKNINVAKGAILDKLLKVILKTEDTQTILNVLRSVSTFMTPYKYKFCDELLLRVIDNKLSIDQLCDFTDFLIKNKSDAKYSETIDKLWVGFVEREVDVNETNIMKIFAVLPAFKASKRTISTLLEQKLADLWALITPVVMQDILNVFVEEKLSSLQSLAVISRWLYTNIHALDEDSLLDIITKLTRLNYTDNLVEKAVEKYIKLKGARINSHILIVGVLNYCMQFQIRNETVLSACSEYFIRNGTEIPPSFLKSFIHPFGYLNFDPVKSQDFWGLTEMVLRENFGKISADDMSSIILSFVYVSKFPLQLVNCMLSAENLAKINSPGVMKKLYLIDTALSLESEGYSGPLLPKDKWSKPVSQDTRIKNIINKTLDSFIAVAGGHENLSTSVLIPYLYSDETYLIDVMLHPAGLGSNTFNWKLKSAKNENTAILIHLPDHYCADSDQLIGPQVMRKRHLKLLGIKVVSLRYSTISQYYTSYNTSGLRNYLLNCITNAEPCE